MLLFGRKGKQGKRKKMIREFSGFGFDRSDPRFDKAETKLSARPVGTRGDRGACWSWTTCRVRGVAATDVCVCGRICSGLSCGLTHAR